MNCLPFSIIGSKAVKSCANACEIVVGLLCASILYDGCVSVRLMVFVEIKVN